MPRPLSDPEFAQFLSDEASVVSGMSPGQSAVVSWNGENVLVFIGPNPTIYGTPDIYLSEVSDVPQLAAISAPGYGTTIPQSWLSALPAATLQVISEEAAEAGALLSQAGSSALNLITSAATGIASAAGQTIAAAAGPVVSSLSGPLVIALVVLGVYMFGGSRR